MLSNIRFIFSAIIIFVLMFCAVVITVLNMYKPTYKVTIGDTFIGYFESENEFEEVYNILYTELENTNESVKIYLDEEPSFEESYIRDSVIASQNVYTALRENLKTEYTVFKVEADDEELIFLSEDEATQYLAKLIDEVEEDIDTNIVQEKSEETVETTTVDVANDIFDEIVDRNKPVVVTTTYVSYSTDTSWYTSDDDVATDDIAAISAAEGGLWPTTATYISSPFGWRGSEWHTGMDIAGSYGDPIYAYKTGVVTFAGWGGDYGYLVKIDHGNGVSSWYAHNSSLVVSAGQTVTQGQIISYEGSTGNSTGNHLHFEIRINGTAVNPYSYIT